MGKIKSVFSDNRVCNRISMNVISVFGDLSFQYSANLSYIRRTTGCFPIAISLDTFMHTVTQTVFQLLWSSTQHYTSVYTQPRAT